MAPSRRRRCAVCHHGFTEDPRVGARQKVCSRSECQQRRREQTQADWRRRHPGYFIQWRAAERAALNASEGIDPPLVPAPLSQLPWELAQEEFGVMGADFLASLGRKLLTAAKDQIRANAFVITAELPKEGPGVAKDQRLAEEPEITEQSPEVGLGVPKDQRRVVPG